MNDFTCEPIVGGCGERFTALPDSLGFVQCPSCDESFPGVPYEYAEIAI